MRKKLPYIVRVYFFLALIPLAGAITAWFIFRSYDGFEATIAAVTIAHVVIAFSAVDVVIGIVLLILLKRADRPMGRVVAALFVAAIPLVAYFILREIP